MSTWKPIIFESSEKYEKLVIESSKKQIRNILKSYVGLYDPFCELIQNAMDAVEKRNALIFSDYSCRIFIKIDLLENTIYIADNGIGFTEDEFKTFLSPNISYKTLGKSRGNKGVGATYLAFGFHKLEMYTKSETYENYASFDNGRAWVYSDNGKRQMPEVYELSSADSNFPYDKGSSFKLYLSSDDDKSVTDLSWRGLSSAESWYYALLTNTPLGHLDLNNNNQPCVKFSIEVNNSNNVSSVKEDCAAEYYFLHKFFPNTAQNIDDVLMWQKRQVDLNKDISDIPQKYKKKRVICKFYSNEEIATLADRTTTLTDKEKELINEYQVVAYGAFLNSTNRWDDINEKAIRARKGLKIVAPGLQLSTGNMIQGAMLQIPLTKNIGYQKQVQIIIHFADAEPDLGRKGFQPDLRVLGEKISSFIVTLGLKPWKKLLAADDSSDNMDQKKKTNYEYIREMEDYEKTNRLIINNKNFFLPSKEISITAKPKSEQDVVVLFSQLLAGGVIRSVELMATSSINQYDGLYRVNIKPPEAIHIYNQDKNPLGLDSELPVILGINTSPLFLEYKVNFDDLINDFENEDKSPTEIGLVVVWTMGSKWKDEYQVISTLLPDYSDRRRYHGFTHEVFYDQTGRNKFDCIVLEELIIYLNNTQEYIDKYSSDYQEW